MSTIVKRRFPIITLCGSTRFKEQFEEIQRKLTLDGFLVISVGLFSHSEENSHEWLDNEKKQMLDDLHKVKIMMSDAIYVINAEQYIGNSTKNEIKFANSLGLPVFYYSTGYEHNKLSLEKMKL